MSGLHDDVDLGHTVAGWAGCVVALAGFALVGVSMCTGRPAGIWAGLGLIPAAGLLTWWLHLRGWGKPSGPRPPAQWDWRVKDPMTGHGRCLACRLAGRGLLGSAENAGTAPGRQTSAELTAAGR
ncbi:hypothetical protein Aph01nite_08660 [Acrocarpospora phusangensis]|uniref:Uncharacterized protein n=1 Tax=Acrocarpospora phusangensis TaxID=1070424 RepID=A0A919Q5J6_9ACTN|nr:HGxxPAAW family protein [Acrocarpospora phusangensis]GIH22556.1 hypothetical protein Aph01nite_08660 [Acrocarpospora phusangensis]